MPGQKPIQEDFFELLGVKDRITIVTEITQFKEIIIPRQSVRLLSDYTMEYVIAYEYMMKRVPDKGYKRVYLTRTALKNNDGINEEFFVEFFKKRDFEIVSPEKYSIAEQVSIISGADWIVSTEGTLTHLALFAKQGTHLTILRRSPEQTIVAQYLINQAKDLNVDYIDVTFNFLPTQHNGGTFLYGPTKHFVSWLNDQELQYTQEEVEFDIKHFAWDYVLLWNKNFNIVKNFKMISNLTMFDVLQNMNQVIGMPPIKKKDYLSKN